MIQNKYRISIVVPVYNEAELIDDCLRAIDSQIHKPYEVIVVDNNSTDSTAQIVAKYPSVKLIKEPRQGLVHARNSGFDYARGDIIGRIDADTIIPSNWTKNLELIFETDSSLDAVSGSVNYYDFPFPTLSKNVDLMFRQHIANKMLGEVFLYGANMGIKRAAWEEVRSKVCLSKGFHEDLDLAIHAQNIGCVVKFDKRLHAAVSLRRVDVGVKDFWIYAAQNPLTYLKHGRRSQRYMYPAIGMSILGFWILKFMYRTFDGNRFSLRKLFAGNVSRVNPASFVD